MSKETILGKSVNQKIQLFVDELVYDKTRDSLNMLMDNTEYSFKTIWEPVWEPVVNLISDVLDNTIDV